MTAYEFVTIDCLALAGEVDLGRRDFEVAWDLKTLEKVIKRVFSTKLGCQPFNEIIMLRLLFLSSIKFQEDKCRDI